MILRIAEIFRPPSNHNVFVVRAVSAVFIAALAMFGYVVYQSLFAPEPFKIISNKLSTTLSADGGLYITETIMLHGHVDDTVAVSKTIYPKVNPALGIMIESGNFTVRKGHFVVYSSERIDPPVYGSWCIDTTYTWWPAWSQREYRMAAPVSCFEGIAE